MDGKSGVSCPALNCGKALSQLELRACIGDQRASQLDRRALELAVSIDPTLHLCPTPDCSMVSEISMRVSCLWGLIKIVDF
jgi:hypothetical protein